ncbi:MAG TPA: hypothetical protein VFG47_20540, partial [Geminicoccaceae bacterium]|nr:hypothetical protein [Geminicoccaceae bacterium]
MRNGIEPAAPRSGPGAGERIVTPMDVRPITAGRVRAPDPAADAAPIAGLHRLAREVFVELGDETLIPLDVRAGAPGRMFVLEADPKPDLRAPASGSSPRWTCGRSPRSGSARPIRPPTPTR